MIRVAPSKPAQRTPRQVTLLHHRLDSVRPHCPYSRDGRFGAEALVAFQEQPCRDRARTPESALAVDDNATTSVERVMQHRSQYLPRSVEAFVGNAAVADGCVVPCESEFARTLGQLAHTEFFKLVLLDQRHEVSGSPVPHGSEIQRQVSLPDAGHCAALLLAGTEGDADGTAGWQRKFRDAEWMGEAGSHLGPGMTFHGRCNMEQAVQQRTQFALAA